MDFIRIKTPGIAHNAYLLGTDGIGIVIDPRRDVDEYMGLASERGLTIKYVLQTHRQEDFVLGSRSIKDLTEATVIAGKHQLSKAVDRQLGDGEIISIGGLTVQALYTPGHTPESVSYAVSMQDNPKKVWAVFTGDALFIGETGRTDLPDRNKTAENAGILYDSVHTKILPLGDSVLLYPAHGAGSVCGGNIAEYDESTLGFERTYNKVFTLSRQNFIDLKLHERIPRPPYFKIMEEQNLAGGEPMPSGWAFPPILQANDFHTAAKSGIIIDTRLPESFAGAHIPGSYSVWMGGLPVFGGWIAADKPDIYLVLERSEDLRAAILHLARIGIDSVEGVLAGSFESWRNAGLPIEMTGTISPDTLRNRPDITVLDVREITEYEDEGHIPAARNAYVGYLPESIDAVAREFPRDKPFAVTCSVGHRASLAVSFLKMKGFSGSANLLGGMTAWKKLALPTDTGPSKHIQLDENSIKMDFPVRVQTNR